MKVRELIERLEDLDVMQEDEIKIYSQAEGFSDPYVEILPSDGMVVLRKFGAKS